MSVLAITHVEGVAVITLDRPRVLNAINEAMTDEIEAALDRIEADETVRALVITGTGRAFCVGSDLKEPGGDADERVRRMHRLIVRLIEFPKISVAAINGLALGGGLEIAMGCTFRVAATDARLGLPEITHSLMPSYGGTQLLPRLIGAARALEIALGGEPIGASRALEIGLVGEISDDPLAAALALARRCTRGSGIAQRAIRQAIMGAIDLSLEAGLGLEHTLVMGVANSEEARAAVAHFATPGAKSAERGGIS